MIRCRSISGRAATVALPKPQVAECEFKGFKRCTPSAQNHAIVHPNAPLTSKPWGTMEFAILDPDGNLITFHEDADA